jgi:Amino acid kinase family.
VSIVCKFGGSSLATAESVKTVAEIIKTNRERNLLLFQPWAVHIKDKKNNGFII